ncbi:MAG: hypothetical protein ACFFD6_03940 [Candidatus Thorarchaeota archaeon]
MANSKDDIRRFEKEFDQKRDEVMRLLRIPSFETVDHVLNEVLGVMSDKKYQDELRRVVEHSYATTYETLSRMLTLGKSLSDWDEEQIDTLIKDSVSDFIRVGLDQTARNVEMYKGFSSKVLDILETKTKDIEKPKPKKSPKKSPKNAKVKDKKKTQL